MTNTASEDDRWVNRRSEPTSTVAWQPDLKYCVCVRRATPTGSLYHVNRGEVSDTWGKGSTEGASQRGLVDRLRHDMCAICVQPMRLSSPAAKLPSVPAAALASRRARSAAAG
jgi:hypothetical protein